MKIKKSLEQAACVLLMLALQKEHKPVKSAVISKRLDVSSSYLKKIMPRLVAEGLVASDASKGGGYTLARPIGEITMLDAFYAIEGHGHFYAISHFAQKIFHHGDRVLQSENEIMDVLARAENLFLKELGGYPFSNFLEGIDYSDGVVDWASLGLNDPKCPARKEVVVEEH
ncbi:Rrf2 family transcriptional regulator [Bifidobacterium psychraerophilum]|jgi:Rrf2 family protein|uniref:RrF2 family transcriptional regulator n=1 Tax=Bifidobacterium psychraerophilum TaxID=218140 RepID=UPI0023EFFD91|nr:Rrf2 family transcriptional regulator [Bifidobacterium psychraerophilum]MCI1660020.1 Rrf2 family transcriptional regulator [Bifidobacterium psychraerophilum]MCI1804789.1 Rrf2 family transcriptional regulator [Bifidobacterium psychraerophilum]MCI2176971.1 Rrf2 family transcriptional regulator [Bifidobacterium psychraerophilum]MCI2181819.1 Rrf2 family transcriptional regulator [Bifidobacterium psychraerophilum]